MALNYQLITNNISYLQFAFDLISKVEGLRLFAYLDTKDPPVPTIGYGFNLTDDTLQPLVFAAFRINPDDDRIAGDQLAVAREQYYLDALRAVINMPWQHGEDDAMRTLLDNRMAARANDSLLAALGSSRETDFRFNSNADPRIKQIFDTAIEIDYERRIDRWLPGIPDSKERLALLSLAYQGLINRRNNGTFVSPSLRNAIIHDDRAEAWYEIRYNTTVEARRILEADTFGLFNPGVEPTNPLTMNDVGAKGAFRAFTRHREKINAGEQAYATNEMLRNASVRAGVRSCNVACAGVTKAQVSGLAM
jgi:hypothetical protein